MINKLNSYSSQKKYTEPISCRNKINFGHKIFLDIGASNSRGSLKILAVSEQGDELYSSRGLLNNDNDEGFYNKEHFLDCIVKAIISAHKKVLPEIDKLNLGEGEKKLTSIGLFVPSSVKNNVIQHLTNLKTSDGHLLNDIDTGRVLSKLSSQNIKGKMLLADNVELKTVQDVTGSAVALSHKFACNKKYEDKFKEGFYGVGAVTGGGLGIFNLKIKDGKTLEIESSGSNYSIQNEEVQKLSRIGASSKALIGNFLDELNVKDENIKKYLTKTGNISIVTQEKVSFDLNKDEDLVQAILDTKLHKICNMTDDKITLKIKDEYRNSFRQARKMAINKYADALAKLAVIKINEGANLLILTGPLSLNLNKTISENSADFQDNSLKDLILTKVNRYARTNKDIQTMIENYNFDVICDQDFMVDNNTEGGYLLFNNKTRLVGQGNRGNWINLDLDEINKD